jgi:tetrahydromethanopterin S-methyltransferase subunit F
MDVADVDTATQMVARSRWLRQGLITTEAVGLYPLRF